MTFAFKTIKTLVAVTALSVTGLTGSALAEEEDHGEEGIATMVELSAAERREKGVQTIRVARRALSEEINAPGEVSLNQYKSSQVTPRISAQVLSRHVQLGDEVAPGDRLVTLSSVQMAEAQGELIVASREWKRVEKLGRKVVSDRRFVAAQVAAQLAHAKVIAFGMTKAAASQLAGTGDASKATGAFTLYARQTGTVMSDDFVLGEFVEPGQVLYAIADESGVWVEARLAGSNSSRVVSGAQVRIKSSDGSIHSGSILQIRHMVDEDTRTLSARIAVSNAADALHAGQFVTALIETGKTAPLLAVPVAAVTLMNGSENVFVVKGNEFTPTPVLLGKTYGNWVEIKGGLSRGDEIASTKIFFLKSMILKSAIGDSH
ncbi:hypothetical protein MNBD_ALPHA06-32 [hydrothermal vent metagenome]|uniref:Uncharacterized protein n=1 Tax=hydrothermal vent metagenome TaxID=652676 RepID=A0A3B0RT72_9ZZZZ